jgi:hypothetical protein
MDLVVGLGKKSLLNQATELFFNDGIPQKTHQIMRHFGLT